MYYRSYIYKKELGLPARLGTPIYIPMLFLK